MTDVQYNVYMQKKARIAPDIEEYLKAEEEHQKKQAERRAHIGDKVADLDRSLMLAIKEAEAEGNKKRVRSLKTASTHWYQSYGVKVADVVDYDYDKLELTAEEEAALRPILEAKKQAAIEKAKNTTPKAGATEYRQVCSPVRLQVCAGPKHRVTTIYDRPQADGKITGVE